MNIRHAARDSHYEKGYSLIDVLIGIGIVGFVFVAIFGVFRLSVSVVTTSKARAGATALANDHMEFIRSLSYDAVGTSGGIPSGSIPQAETVTLNGIDYERRTFIQYVDDPADGLGFSDENSIQTDYKLVKVEMTWHTINGTSTASAISNVVPEGIETVEGGGTLTLDVIDALANPVEGVEVRITNTDVNPQIDVTTFTNINGRVSLPGAPEDTNYDIVVTKSGYSTSQTYEPDSTNVSPSPPPATVIEGETTTMTFRIDTVATKTILTFEQEKEESFEDEFDDISQISTLIQTFLNGDVIELAYDGPNRFATGTVSTITIQPSSLSEWQRIDVTSATPASTTLVYRVYDMNGGRTLISDADLPGNSAGFSDAILDISGLPVHIYSALQVEAYFETEDTAITPALSEWSVIYEVGPTPLSNIGFQMRGDKVIGETASSSQIYKYSTSLQTDSAAQLVVSDLEWDTYTITVSDTATGYDVTEICDPQPRPIDPGVATTTTITLTTDTTHTLRTIVVDGDGDYIPGVSVRLYKTTGTPHDETIVSSSCGQSFFKDVPQGLDSLGTAYSIDISKTGYQSETITPVDVSNVTTQTIVITPL